MTKHRKAYRNGTVSLMCESTVIVGEPWPQANFLLDCPKCGMAVQTTGVLPDTDKIQESN